MTKESIVLGMISKPGGATLAELLATTGWLRGWASHHNTRNAIGVRQRVCGKGRYA